eukprot:s2442_g11.t1
MAITEIPARAFAMHSCWAARRGFPEEAAGHAQKEAARAAHHGISQASFRLLVEVEVLKQGPGEFEKLHRALLGASRATALGLDEAVLAKFVGSGIDCMSKYAFLSSFVPGNTDEKPFTDAVVKVLGRDPSIAELSVLRRLLHESYSLTVSELQVQVERTDDSAPRKLAAPDRADRLQRQQLRLSGLNIHGPMLPGHAVIDKCVQMYEDNVLHYLSPQQCPCRDDEVKFKKDRDDKMLSVDGAGHVSLRSQPAKVDADVSSDLLLKLALTRRGLALDQAGVITFSEHERWVETLFVARFRDPPDNYARVTLTLQQLMHADR